MPPSTHACDVSMTNNKIGKSDKFILSDISNTFNKMLLDCFPRLLCIITLRSGVLSFIVEWTLYRYIVHSYLLSFNPRKWPHRSVLHIYLNCTCTVGCRYHFQYGQGTFQPCNCSWGTCYHRVTILWGFTWRPGAVLTFSLSCVLQGKEEIQDLWVNLPL